MDTVIDKRTKEYRDNPTVTGVNFEVCNDPHGTGCTIVHPPNDVPRSRTEPCYTCIRRNY